MEGEFWGFLETPAGMMICLQPLASDGLGSRPLIRCVTLGKSLHLCSPHCELG